MSESMKTVHADRCVNSLNSDSFMSDLSENVKVCGTCRKEKNVNSKSISNISIPEGILGESEELPKAKKISLSRKA